MKKLFRHTIIVRVLIVLALSAALLFSSLAYLAYRDYSTPRNTLRIPLLLKDISTVLRELDDERLYSASYLATHKGREFKALQQARERVDTQIDRMTKENDLSCCFGQEIREIGRAIRRSRADVESPDSDPAGTLFGYHDKVFVPFDQMIGDMILDRRGEASGEYLSAYERVILAEENSVMENSFVYFLLLRGTPISEEERSIWQQLVHRDRQPRFEKMSDMLMASELGTLLSPDLYRALLEEERKEIMEAPDSDRYGAMAVSWLEKMNRKMAYFAHLEKELLSGIGKSERRSTLWLRGEIAVYGLLAIVFSLLFLKLITLHSRQIENRKLYEDTLRDIELVFTPDQQKKLRRLIESGKLNMIYKFLIQAIEDANRTKDLFLANMSHEIRTPLNGIVGFTQLLKETETTEEQKEFLGIIEKSSDHLLSIVNDILDLAKIKAQKIELESIAFDPIEYFEAAVESYAGRALRENIDFNVFIDPALPTRLTGDPTKISQVIINLISNAIKFTPKNGEVNVRIEKISQSDGGVKARFSVSDTGIGIAKEQQKRILEAFSQADVSTSRKYGGTGLGLSISGKLIDLMGGELHIRSVQDEGSTFYFTLQLPLAEGSERRIVEERSGLRIGVLDHHIGEHYTIDENLERYISFTGATIIHYTDETLLEAERNGRGPDTLFIDHKFRQREGEIERFLDIGSRIVIVTTGEQKRYLKQYADRIDKILYKPVTFSKTLKALSEKEEQAEEARQIYFEELHILVAEDNPINQSLIINVLKRMGIEVTIANDGREALELRKSQHYDMIFMDIKMPVMGGIEATAKILSYERSSHEAHIPIIALTANALAENRASYLGAGMDGYLSKPIKLDALRGIFLDYFEEKIIERVEV